ncbi:MAG: hypothetical protein JNL90_01700 [Planctomycetes bacterium]|nr:hypothetical protein [Planctomycetota bacterium]
MRPRRLRWLLLLLALFMSGGRGLPQAARRTDAPALDGRPLFAATWYGWQQWPDRHLGTPDAPLPRSVVAPSACDPTRVEWHRRELDAAAAAGLDALLLANVPAPTPFEALLRALARALEQRAAEGAPPVRVGLLLDPFFTALEQAGGEGSASLAPLDLREQATRAAFCAPLDLFFALIPPPHRALLHERPLVVVAGDALVAAAPQDLFESLEQEGAVRWGASPWFVVEQSWQLPDRAQWRRRATLFGLQRSGAVATLGAGFLDGEAARGLIRPPASRAQFLADAAPLLRVPRGELDLLLFDSWNQCEDGSALQPTLESGTRYAGAIRRLREAWERGAAGGVAADRTGDAAATALLRDFSADSLTPNAPLLERAYAPDRAVALADHVEWRADGGGEGLALRAIAPAPAAEAARFVETPESAAALDLPQAGTTLRFELAAPFRTARADRFTIECEAVALGAAPPALEVRVGERRVALAATGTATPLESWSTRDLATFELHVASPCALRRLRITRVSDALPSGGAGLDHPTLFARFADGGARRAEALAELSRARPLGARWLRFEVEWGTLEQGGVLRDETVAALVEWLRAVRAAELEPIVALTAPPADALPIAAHAERCVDFVTALLGRCDESLRLLELFPRGNLPGGFAPAPDLVGQMRVQRQVAARLHADFPRVALLFGASRGNDPAYWQAIEGLREPYSHDAAALELDASLGRRGSATFARSLAELATTARRGGPQRPLLLSVDAEPPLRATDDDPLRPLAARCLTAALERIGRALPPTAPLHLLDPGELPRVAGVTTARARDWLAATGRPVVVAELPELLAAVNGEAARVVAIGSGEWWPLELLDALPGWLDRGGLLVSLGGLPAGRAARRRTDGSFEEAGSERAPAWREELGIARWRPRGGGEAPAASDPRLRGATLAAGLTFPALLLPTEAALPAEFAAWFDRRAGAPRDPRGLHRYDALVQRVAADGSALGDGVALLQYAGGREGALLLMGWRDDRGELTAERAATALEHDLAAAARSAPRSIVLWRVSESESRDRDGDIAATSAPSPLDPSLPAAAAFARFAAALERGEFAHK